MLSAQGLCLTHVDERKEHVSDDNDAGENVGNEDECGQEDAEERQEDVPHQLRGDDLHGHVVAVEVGVGEDLSLIHI